MNMIDEVLLFSRDYINNKKERTLLKKRKISEAYRELFGKEIKGSCSTCYIEALLEIVKSFKNINMATQNYELKRGVLLESFGHPEKTCTNDTITDELAQWHLAQCPAKAVLFARMPGGFVAPPATVPPPPAPAAPQRGEGRIIPPEVIIIPPAKIAQEDPVKRKALVDKALELGFKSGPENPIELITSDELNVIIPNLEKAKNAAPVIIEPQGKKEPVKRKSSKTKK